MPRKSGKHFRKGAAPLFAAELVKAKQRAGLTNVALQKMTGISRVSLIDYEAGRGAPGLRYIWLLCRALRVTPNKLIFGAEHPFSGSGARPPRSKKAPPAKLAKPKKALRPRR